MSVGLQPSDGTPVPSRPSLLPDARWARIALALLCAFAFVRGAMWSATTPSFWGPDEDYHFMYVDHVATTGTIIDPDKPLYSSEYVHTVNQTQFNAYGVGPRVDFSGDPKAALGRLARLPEGDRDQVHVGRDPAVVHPPLYYYLAAIPDKVSEWGGGNALPTRMLWVRFVSALIGVVAVYAAWLLAAQVLRRKEGTQLLVGLLVATQPMLGFLSGFVSNDIAVIATFTLVTAYCAFLLRVAPTPRQGVWLGGLLVLAVLTKSTALVLLPVAGLALLLQHFTYRSSWRSTLRTSLYCAAPLLVGALWWYVWARASYGTFTGEVLVNGVASSSASSGTHDGPGLSGYVTLARGWIADAYKTAWWHFMNFEAPRGRWFYFAPAAIIATGVLGVVGLGYERRRFLLDRDDARLRQAVLLTAAFFALIAPFLYLDLNRAADGLGFLVAAGRFVMPAYPGLVVLVVLGLGWLLSDRARPIAFGALAIGTVAMCWNVWKVYFVERYYGTGSLDEVFGRMAFDRPGWVQPTTYWIALLLCAALLLAFAVATIWRGNSPLPHVRPLRTVRARRTAVSS